jgi:hypothetical protein
MADFRLIIFALIMSVFSIASNSILINKEKTKDALNDNEYKFAIVSLVGSILVLMASLYFGFQGGAEYRNSIRG